MPDAKSLGAEGLGTALLLFVIVTSGIVAESLTTDIALQLGLHAIVVGAGLAVLIVMLAPVSGAHFNPAVSLGFAIRGAISWATFGWFAVVQTVGAVVGVVLANLVFALPWIEVSENERSGLALGLSELIGTFVLVLLILALVRVGNAAAIPVAVGAWIVVIIFATPSTGFANPAVTIARTLTDTFTGIAPGSTALFLAAQVVGAILAAVTVAWMYGAESEGSEEDQL